MATVCQCPPTLRMIIASVIMMCLFHRGMAYLNAYDHDLNFSCPNEYQFVSHIESIHDSHTEDRMFDMTCSDVADDVVNAQTTCYTTGLMNQYDQLLVFQCPGNHYVSGMYSHHDNRHEDRAWRFKCCELHDIHLDDCDFTDWTNKYDGAQNFNAPAGKVLKGVVSEHDNGKEDRIYKYELCNVIRTHGTEVITGK